MIIFVRLYLFAYVIFEFLSLVQNQFILTANNYIFWFKQYLILFMASYYRQLSADIKMINYKNKISNVRLDGQQKTGINFMIFILIFVENSVIRFYTRFSVG